MILKIENAGRHAGWHAAKNWHANSRLHTARHAAQITPARISTRTVTLGRHAGGRHAGGHAPRHAGGMPP